MPLLLLITICILLAPDAYAQNHQVDMKNQGELGYMVFEPAYLQIKPGDTVTFNAVDLGHNAQIIRFMKPRKAKAIIGALNEEITMQFDEVGFYGIKCHPHFTMGMVMLIEVGEADASAFVIPPSLPKFVKQRFADIIEHHVMR